MEINNHKTSDYSAVLIQRYGKLGTTERTKFDEKAYAFYTSQILLNARKEAQMTQSERRTCKCHEITITSTDQKRNDYFKRIYFLQNNNHYLE